MRKTRTLAVLVDGHAEQWEITVKEHRGKRGHPMWRLTLRKPGGSKWVADQWNVFDGLLELRRQVEPLGILLCCNGSRRDAWASGMARDMGGGFGVYLCAEVPKGERPPMVGTLDPAPHDEIVPVADQFAWHEAWTNRT